MSDLAISFSWDQYTGNLEWLPASTIYITRHGSHAYGTNIPSSDLDLRGIAIPPAPYYLGFTHTFEQVSQHEPDLTIFELTKFFKLAADCNPNALEILFTDPSDHLLVRPPMQTLFLHKETFLSQKAKHTFSGYAMSQLKRINLHYRWLKNPPTAAPTREEFGLPPRTVIPADQLVAAAASIKKRLDEWNWHDLEEVDPSVRQAIKDEFFRRLAEITHWKDDVVEEKTWLSAARSIGFSDNFIELLDKERRYNSKLREWQHYNDWKTTRNPARAELEAKFGYDTKHAMHLVRLMRMCREILEGKGVRVRRPDAEELLKIREGIWDYFDLVTWAEAQDKELTELVQSSPLPKQPDRKLLDRLCVGMVGEFIKTT